MEYTSVALAFTFTLGAGLATGIGSTLAFFPGRQIPTSFPAPKDFRLES